MPVFLSPARLCLLLALVLGLTGTVWGIGGALVVLVGLAARQAGGAPRRRTTSAATSPSVADDVSASASSRA